MPGTSQEGSRTAGWKYQAGHAFQRGQPVYLQSEGHYALASIDTGFDGIVGDVAVNRFELVANGELNGFRDLTVGVVYSLGTVAGQLYASSEFPVYKAIATDTVLLMSSGSGSSGGGGIPNSSVTNADLATMPAYTLKGNALAGAANPQDLTATDVKSMLDIQQSDVFNLESDLDFIRADITEEEARALEAETVLQANIDAETSARIADVDAEEARAIAAEAALDARLDTAEADIIALQAVDASLAGIAFSGSASDLVTGIIPDARMPDLTGDVTTVEGAVVTTIGNDVVSNAKLANMAANTIKGNNTGGAADPLDLTVAQVKTLLALTASDVSGLATIATSGSASDLSAGTIPDARMPDLTGDVTTAEGAVATTIANDAVTYAKMQNVSAASKLLGRGDSGAGDPQEITLGTNLSMSGTTLNASGGGISDGDKGDITVSGGGAAWTIDNDVVTYAKMQNVGMAAALLGRGNGSGPGDVQEITLDVGFGMVATLLSPTSPFGRLLSQTPTAITSAGSASVDTLHVVSGTSADYDITLPSSPTTGTVVAFYVKDYAAANKQYRLDAGASGSPKIAGRTRYLILVHTNVAVLRFDGTDWQPLVMCLDTPWVSGGTLTITGTTANPVKGTTGQDRVTWRRSGKTLHARYEYTQTAAGSGTTGTGVYKIGVPIGAVDTTLVDVGTGTTLNDTETALCHVGYGVANMNSGQAGPLMIGVYDSTNLRAHFHQINAGNREFWRSTRGALNNSTLQVRFTVELPMTDW